jgi:hypothetical protein
MIKKLVGIVSFIVLLNVLAFSQSKSIPDAQNEIKTFQNFSSFAVSYNDPKDLTTATVILDIREDSAKPFQKQFKKFEWEVTSVFAGNKIDDKPVRHTLCLNTQSKRFFFASNNLLTIFISGEEIDFDIPNRSTEVKGGKVKETLCWEITRQIITDFSKATAIDFHIGPVKSSLSAGKLQTIRDYAKLLENN